METRNMRTLPHASSKVPPKEHEGPEPTLVDSVINIVDRHLQDDWQHNWPREEAA